MITSNKLQKAVGILQLIVAAIDVIWLVLVTIMPPLIGMRGPDEMKILWPLLIVPISMTLPCAPFILSNLLMGLNILHKKTSAKKYKLVCAIKFSYTFIVLSWMILFILWMKVEIFITPLFISSLVLLCLIIALGCISFLFEIIYANKIFQLSKEEI